MKQQVDAVYSDGVFKPTERPGLADGQAVRLTIEPLVPFGVDLLALVGQVYEGLSDETIREIEAIALDRSSFFSERRP